MREGARAHMAAWMDSSTAPWWNMCFTALTGTSLASAGMQDVYVTAAKAPIISNFFEADTLQCIPRICTITKLGHCHSLHLPIHTPYCSIVQHPNVNM